MNSAVADYQVTTRFDPELYALYIALRMFEQTHPSPSVPATQLPTHSPAGADNSHAKGTNG